MDEHVAHLAGLVEAQRAEEAGLAAAMADLRAVVEATTGATRELARGHDTLDRRLTEALARFGASQADAAMVDEAVTSRLAEAEGRLSHQIAGQWGDLETAIEASVAAHVAGTAGAGDALAAGQSLLEERLDALAGQLAEVASRLDARWPTGRWPSNCRRRRRPTSPRVTSSRRWTASWTPPPAGWPPGRAGAARARCAKGAQHVGPVVGPQRRPRGHGPPAQARRASSAGPSGARATALVSRLPSTVPVPTRPSATRPASAARRATTGRRSKYRLETWNASTPPAVSARR